MTRRLLVTGASGFVGGAVVRAALAAGWSVRATSRQAVALPGVEHVRLDLDIGHVPDALLEGVDVVVHAAAWVGDGGPPARVRRTTVGGTGAVVDAVLRARAGGREVRLVHVSSSSVYDPRRPSLCATEEQAPVGRYLGPYAAAKADAERLVTAAVTRDGLDAVVLRPHAVYGPGDTTLLPRLESLVRRGRLPLPGGGRVRHQLTHVTTLAAAALAAADLPASRGRLVVANVADAEPVVLRDVVVELLALRGRPVRVVDVPVRPMRVGASLGDVVQRATGGRVTPRLTRYALSHLAAERTYDLSVARDVLGIHIPRTDLTGAASW